MDILITCLVLLWLIQGKWVKIDQICFLHNILDLINWCCCSKYVYSAQQVLLSVEKSTSLPAICLFGIIYTQIVSSARYIRWANNSCWRHNLQNIALDVLIKPSHTRTARVTHMAAIFIKYWSQSLSFLVSLSFIVLLHWEIRPVSSMTRYSTQSHYPDTESSPYPILIMLSTWLGSDKYQFYKPLVWLDPGFKPTISNTHD